MKKLVLLFASCYGYAHALNWYRREGQWTPVPDRLRLAWEFWLATAAATPHHHPIAVARVVFGYRDGNVSVEVKDCLAGNTPGHPLQHVIGALDTRCAPRPPAAAAPPLG